MNIEILKHLQIKDYKQVYDAYEAMGYKFIGFPKRELNECLKMMKNGDYELNKIDINYEDNNYVTYQLKLNKGYDISIMKKCHTDILNHCIHIDIDKRYSCAFMNHISYMNVNEHILSAFNYSMREDNLLKVTIDLLRDHKTELKINRVYLYDRSFFNWKGKKDYHLLPLIHMLSYGDTFYGKYGFKPFCGSALEPINCLIEQYNQDKKFILTTKIENTPLFECIESSINKLNKKIEFYDFQKACELLEQYKNDYKNAYINDFFKNYFENFDGLYPLFGNCHIEFAIRMGMDCYHNRCFYLDL